MCIYAMSFIWIHLLWILVYVPNVGFSRWCDTVHKHASVYLFSFAFIWGHIWWCSGIISDCTWEILMMLGEPYWISGIELIGCKCPTRCTVSKSYVFFFKIKTFPIYHYFQLLWNSRGLGSNMHMHIILITFSPKF